MVLEIKWFVYRVYGLIEENKKSRNRIDLKEIKASAKFRKYPLADANQAFLAAPYCIIFSVIAFLV